MPPDGMYNTMTATESKVYLPERFACRSCQKIKTAAQFSNKELNAYKYKKANGQNVTGLSAKLRCRGCSGDQVHELQCQGPCNLYKGLDGFSKTQRKRPEQAWCITCIYWKEANEPGLIPLPAENMVFAPDEERDVTEFVDGSVLGGNPEGESDSDDEEFGLPRLSMGSNSIGGAPDTFTFPGARSTPSTSQPGYVPPHLRRPSVKSSTFGTQSSESNPYAKHTFSDTIETIGDDSDTEDNSKEKTTENKTPGRSATAINRKDNGLSSNASREKSQGWAKIASTRALPQPFPNLVRPRQQPQQSYEDDSPDEM